MIDSINDSQNYNISYPPKDYSFYSQGKEHPQRFSNYQELINTLKIYKDEVNRLQHLLMLASDDIEKKNNEIQKLIKQLTEANSTIQQIQTENKLLLQKLKGAEANSNLFKKFAFGDKKTENQSPAQSSTTKKSKERGAKDGHKGHGRKIPDNLPIIENIIDIPEDKKHCECCGNPLHLTDLVEESWEICCEKIYYVLKHIRKIYKKNCGCNRPLITAPPPVKLIPRGKFSTEFWVDILINKYYLALPLERQIVDMRQYGLAVGSGTLCGGLENIYHIYLKYLYEALLKDLKNYTHYHADETRWKLFVKIDDKKNYIWYIFVFVTKETCVFVLSQTRSSKPVLKTLFDIQDEDDLEDITDFFPLDERKKMSVDRFSAYKFLRNKGFVELSFCWSHVRRDFLDAVVKYPELEQWGEEWILRISLLYHINNQRIEYDKDTSEFQNYHLQLKIQIDEIYNLINLDYNNIGQKEVMNSMIEHWNGLILFVDHPELPMDNNLSERMIRLIALCRKNYYGNHSKDFAELSCAMFSIIQTCILNNISPRKYLFYYLNECAKNHTPPVNLEAFLPHKLTPDIKCNLLLKPYP